MLAVRTGSEGWGKATSKRAGFEDAIPAVGFATVIVDVPAVASRDAVTVADRRVELTTVVDNAVVVVPAVQLTVAPEAKPVPCTFKVKPAPPGAAEMGWIVSMNGTASVADDFRVKPR